MNECWPRPCAKEVTSGLGSATDLGACLEDDLELERGGDLGPLCRRSDLGLANVSLGPGLEIDELGPGLGC